MKGDTYLSFRPYRVPTQQIIKSTEKKLNTFYTIAFQCLSHRVPPLQYRVEIAYDKQAISHVNVMCI